MSLSFKRLIPLAGRFVRWNNPVVTVQAAGWAPGPVLTVAKNLTPTGIRSPDRQTRSKSLYRHPGPHRFKRCIS